MLINHREKIVIYTPFKNYSTSLCEYFKRLDEWEEIHRPHPTILGDSYDIDRYYNLSYKHGNMPPSSCISYTKILPLRNPYERVLSSWKWCCKTANLKCSFGKYLYDSAKYPALFPVSRFYPHDFVVRTESLKEDFEKCGINLDMNTFPHLNKHGSDVGHKLTELEKEIIYWWHKEDFDVGSYDK